MDGGQVGKIECCGDGWVEGRMEDGSLVEEGSFVEEMWRGEDVPFLFLLVRRQEEASSLTVLCFLPNRA